MMTSLEWLKDQLECFGDEHRCEIHWDVFDKLFDKAEQIEKQINILNNITDIMTFNNYRKKPVVINAIKWDGSESMAIEIASIEDFAGMLDYTSGEFEGFYIDTLEGRMKVSPSDYVIRGVKGEYYACKEEIFNMTYTKE